MGAIIGIALVLIFIAMPFVTLAKISGLAAEIRELKMLLGILIDSRAKTKDKTNVEVAPNVKSTSEPVAKPLVPPHVPAVITCGDNTKRTGTTGTRACACICSDG